LSVLQKTGASLFAGGLGSFIGTPFDLALVRMQSDMTLPVEERRNYKNVFDAFRRIIGEEGLLACWSGATPTILRACALNIAMLVTYDESKERLTAYLGKDANQRLIQIGSSMISSVATSCASLPFDNIKTKL
jgi:solute carrier family 25 oxoglutarate transporter 11